MSNTNECEEQKLDTEGGKVPIPKAHNVNTCPNCNPVQDDPYLAFLRET